MKRNRKLKFESLNDRVLLASAVDFVNVWHGHGPGHQANNNPGDTAQDRHNFLGASAGKSGVYPTYGRPTIVPV